MTKSSTPGPAPIGGLWTAVPTPLDGQLKANHAALAAHCKDLMARGADGVAPFGTTGEGTSFTAAERTEGTDALIAQGIPASKIVLGNGSAALGDAIAMARHSVKVGLAGVLTLPPFFFKNLDDEGVYASFAEIVERTGDERLRLDLQHPADQRRADRLRRTSSEGWRATPRSSPGSRTARPTGPTPPSC